MAYKRRYLSGQEAVTVDIAEQAVTADKIAPGAVDTEELAPDSVTTEKIHDQAVETQDIKDQAVTTPKIADQGVTTEKLADQSVTSSKLDPTSSIVTRPVTPGLATEEIADEVVTPAKLADDAVETDKIKDGAVSTPKIAHDAITEDKIADDAVEAEHIENGAVVAGKLANNSVVETNVVNGSVTNDKLGANSVSESKIAAGAVTTDKLDGDSVTEPKLATAALALRHLESFNVRVLNVHEDFCGQDISARWRKRIDAGGYVYWVTATPMRGLALGTPAINGQGVILDWNQKGINPSSRRTSISFYIPGTTVDRTYQTRELGLVYVFDKSSYILFTAEDLAGAVPNWYARCKEGGVETAEDTGVAVTEEPQVLTIDYVSDSDVRFYINGVLVKTITTNIPSGSALDPWLSLIARSAAARLLYVQMMSLLHERPPYA